MNRLLEGKSARKLIIGIKVERASALLPQTGGAPIFNIIGGRVAITQIIGECTVIMGAVANNTTLDGTPAVGTAVPLCLILDTSTDEAGTLYGLDGNVGNALIGLAAGALPGQDRDIILPVGTLDLTCAANNTGQARWTVFYVPVDDGAYMTPA